MKTTSLLLAASLLIVATLRGHAREFTSTDGKTLEAEFLGVSGENVRLKRASDGKEFKLPLARLSTEDQAWIKEQPGPATGSATEKPDMKKPAGEPAKIEGEYASLITGDWALSKFKDLPFALYAAKDLDANTKLPLLLILHGRSDNDENGQQIGFSTAFSQEARFKKNPCIIVSPLCYQPYGGTGGGWNDKPGDLAIDLVKSLIKGLPVDEDRVYVMGYSMGGFGTVHLLAKESRLFAAGVAVAGAGSPGDAGDLKRMPLWLFHAKDDDVVKIDGSRSFAEAFPKSSKTFKFTEYDTGGHGIIGKVIDDEEMHTWLFSQKKGK